ncbi:unnamed protein product [Vicia faba]|uniref:Uncharacterized protein n=1 Tax=Vicia faba TaxID=3906 RepID=A0AAV0YKZ6_VICFA|nr:unnamed protein product [Vicia faba]
MKHHLNQIIIQSNKKHMLNFSKVKEEKGVGKHPRVTNFFPLKNWQVDIHNNCSASVHSLQSLLFKINQDHHGGYGHGGGYGYGHGGGGYGHGGGGYGHGGGGYNGGGVSNNEVVEMSNEVNDAKYGRYGGGSRYHYGGYHGGYHHGGGGHHGGASNNGN